MSETTPTPVVRLVPGVVQALPSAVNGVPLGVNVGGTFPPVWWPAGYIPTAGDAVKVLLVDGTAVVHSPVVTTQRPLTGTVQGAAAGGAVPVTTVVGILSCRYVGTAPAVGTLVRLDWQATTPWVWPNAASAPPVVPIVPPVVVPPIPPPVVTTGMHSVTAYDSGSWSNQGWSSFHGNDLTQGAYGGGSAYTGAWFYGGAPQQIAGATVTGFRVRLGDRRRIGSYNSSVALHLFLTSNSSRPAGDTTRTAGPSDITLGPGAGAQWVTLPTVWGQTLVNNGGGIGIGGNPYAGVVGIGSDPESGQLQFDWTR